MGTVVWEPVEDTERIARGLRTMIEWNDLYEYIDCKVCRAIPVTDAAPVPSAEVATTIEGLLTSAIAGTESTIRTRDYHGLRKFATTEEEWIVRYKAALAWLNGIGGDNAA